MSIKEKGKQLAASMRRLATTSGLAVNELRVLIALERVAARLVAVKRLREALVFKGGFALLKTASSRRFTRDLDALVTQVPREAMKVEIIQALEADLEDGLWFGDVQMTDLPDHGEYEGIRFSAAYQIGEIPAPAKIHKLSRVHFDIAFGDILPLGSHSGSMRSIVPDFADISWQVYPLASIVAEKLETLVRRGSLNSRAKDCYDLVLLLEIVTPTKDFARVVRETFSHRNIELPGSFEQMFLSLDLTVLRNAWRSVTLTEDALSFDECVQKLTVLLRGVDALLKQPIGTSI